MGRISETDRARNEGAIRAAIDRLLRGELPPGGRCDLKTLAAEAGVTRTGFYPKKDRDGSVREGPYQHLGDEFVRRLTALREAEKLPDPRDAQIKRLKAESALLKKRVADRDAVIEELTHFRNRALSRLAAQHAEIQQLRSTQTHRPLNPSERPLALIPHSRKSVPNIEHSPAEGN